MSRPIDSILINGLKPSKEALRQFLTDNIPLVFEEGDDVEAFDLPGCLSVIIGATLYTYDIADVTTPHDGVNCLVSLDGRRYKPALIGVPDGSITAAKFAAGAVAASLGATAAELRDRTTHTNVIPDSGLPTRLTGAVVVTDANSFKTRGLAYADAGVGHTNLPGSSAYWLTYEGTANYGRQFAQNAFGADRWTRRNSAGFAAWERDYTGAAEQDARFLNAGNLNAGTLPDARFPARIGSTFPLTADAFATTIWGWYYLDTTSTNTPASGFWFMFHDGDGNGSARRYIWNLLNGERYLSIDLAGSGAGAWKRIRETEEELNTLYFQRSATLETSLDGTNDRIPIFDASANAVRLTSPASIAGTNTAGVGTVNGRAGTVTLGDSDQMARLGNGGNLPLITDCFATNFFGVYRFEAGCANAPFSGFGFLFHFGDSAGSSRRYAWNILTGAYFRSIDLGGGASPGAWQQVYETASEINGVSDARYLRKLSSGRLSTADSSAMRHDGNPADAATNTAELNTLLGSIPSGGGKLEVAQGIVYCSPLATVSNRHVVVEGLGKGISTVVLTGSSGNWLTVSQNSQNLRTELRKITVRKHSDASTAGAVLRAEYPVVSSSLPGTCVVKEVECRGVDGTTAFGALFRPVNAWGIQWHDLEFEGISNNTTHAVAAVDVLGKCTVSHGDLVKAFWAQYGGTRFEGGHFSEGGYLSRYHIVACDWILLADNGQDAPGMSMHMMHGETFVGGLKILNHPQIDINDLLVYKRLSSTSNWTMVWLEGNAGYSQDVCTMRGVRGWGAKGAAAGGTAVGMVIEDSDGGMGSDIMLWDMDLGADLFNNSSWRLEFGHSNVTTLHQNVPGSANISTYSLPLTP